MCGINASPLIKQPPLIFVLPCIDTLFEKLDCCDSTDKLPPAIFVDPVEAILTFLDTQLNPSVAAILHKPTRGHHCYITTSYHTNTTSAGFNLNAIHANKVKHSRWSIR